MFFLIKDPSCEYPSSVDTYLDILPLEHEKPTKFFTRRTPIFRS